jgi:hypothetical protein
MPEQSFRADSLLFEPKHRNVWFTVHLRSHKSSCLSVSVVFRPTKLRAILGQVAQAPQVSGLGEFVQASIQATTPAKPPSQARGTLTYTHPLFLAPANLRLSNAIKPRTPPRQSSVLCIFPVNPERDKITMASQQLSRQLARASPFLLRQPLAIRLHPSARSFQTSSRLLQDAAPLPQKKPVGAFRGG